MLDSTTLADVMDMLPDPFTATLIPSRGGSQITASGARYRPLSRKELDWAASLGIGVPTRAFLLPANQLNGYMVVQTDVLVDQSNQKWAINYDASLEMQGCIWKCFATQAP